MSGLILSDPTLQELIDCAEREDALQEVNPFISAIHGLYGPRIAAGIFKEWCDKRGIIIYKERTGTN